jgi:hypothetical protein
MSASGLLSDISAWLVHVSESSKADIRILLCAKSTPRLSNGSLSPMGSERCPQDERPTGLELRGVANLDKLFERARRSCASF